MIFYAIKPNLRILYLIEKIEGKQILSSMKNLSMRKQYMFCYGHKLPIYKEILANHQVWFDQIPLAIISNFDVDTIDLILILGYKKDQHGQDNLCTTSKGNKHSMQYIW